MAAVSGRMAAAPPDETPVLPREHRRKSGQGRQGHRSRQGGEAAGKAETDRKRGKKPPAAVLCGCDRAVKSSDKKEHGRQPTDWKEAWGRGCGPGLPGAVPGLSRRIRVYILKTEGTAVLHPFLIKVSGLSGGLFRSGDPAAPRASKAAPCST